LYEYIIIGVRNHVGRHPPHDLRLPDVEGQLQPLGNVFIGVRHNHVGERKVDRRRIVSRLQRRINRRWGVSNGNEIRGWLKRHHHLAIVVELRGRTVASRDHS
jgi:hypothetical protein